MQLYPPAAPTNVVVTARVVNTNADRLTLTWTASVGAANYTIQMANYPGFTGAIVTTVSGNATSWNSGNVPRNSNYYLRIMATNAAGASAWVNANPFPIHTP